MKDIEIVKYELIGGRNDGESVLCPLLSNHVITYDNQEEVKYTKKNVAVFGEVFSFMVWEECSEERFIQLLDDVKSKIIESVQSMGGVKQ